MIEHADIIVGDDGGVVLALPKEGGVIDGVRVSRSMDAISFFAGDRFRGGIGDVPAEAAQAVKSTDEVLVVAVPDGLGVSDVARAADAAGSGEDAFERVLRAAGCEVYGGVAVSVR